MMDYQKYIQDHFNDSYARAESYPDEMHELAEGCADYCTKVFSIRAPFIEARWAIDGLKAEFQNPIIKLVDWIIRKMEQWLQALQA